MRDLDSVTQLLKHLDKFKQISGLEINTNKTEALWLGCWRSRKDKPFGFRWPEEPVYALGIHFSYDLKQTNALNFEEKVLFFRKNTQYLEKKEVNFNWKNQYCQDIRFVETHVLQFVTDRI